MHQILKGLWIAFFAFLAPISWTSGCAQNFYSSGGNWSSSYGFPSATDRSVGLQTANAIRAAKNPITSSHYYDYRSGYVEYYAAPGSSMTSDFQLGDTNSNSVGAMNTGDLNVTVEGEGNSVNASSAADSQGCIDGSIGSALSTIHDSSNTSDYMLNGISPDNREDC